MYDDDDGEFHGAAVALSVLATIISVISLLVYVAQHGFE